MLRMEEDFSTDPSVSDILGQLEMPARWHVFTAGDRKLPLPENQMLQRRPDRLMIAGQTLEPVAITPVRCQHDLCEQLGTPPDAMEQTAYVYLELDSTQAQDVSIGLGWDHWLKGWFNGKPLFEGRELTSDKFPSTIQHQRITLALQAGFNTLVFRVVGGRGPCILAVGGPSELRHGDDRTLLDDPLVHDSRWAQASLKASPSAARKPVEIASRRELFIDDYLIDSLAGAADRRLHHPIHREVVLTLDRSWEGNYNGNFLPMVALQDEDRFRLYYYAANWQGPGQAHEYGLEQAKHSPHYKPVTCMAESTDGIHFERPNLNLYEHKGSKNNNIVLDENRHLTPFIDTNPNAAADARYKSTSRHLEQGLGAYASADGIHWRLYHDRPIITEGKFDSQNLIFWDDLRQCYVEYHRGQPNTPAVRGIMTATSPDFIHWEPPQQVTFTDDRPEQMYTNCIAPYPRAPHLYIGMPARYVGLRVKDHTHVDSGVSDSILMSSRDGKMFDRWEEGFLRPGADPEAWTDRNNYLAWGMLQTSPRELSVYWCEHNGHPGLRIRRGSLRIDGFASLHAPGKAPGEMLTKPLTFTGNQLEVNYATSAVGSILFELCDEQGRAIPGYALGDSEILYGNEIDHIVRWPAAGSYLGHLAGKTVRLRIRLHDADLYAFRFKD